MSKVNRIGIGGMLLVIVVILLNMVDLGMAEIGLLMLAVFSYLFIAYGRNNQEE